MESTPLTLALAQAPQRPGAQLAKPEREFFVFRAGSFTFGVNSAEVRQVTRIERLTPLPRAPAFILGAFGHRGEVLPLVDLLRFLALGELKVGARSRLFVGMGEGHMVAFLTEAVVGLRRIQVADIMPAPSGGGSTEFLTGVLALKDLGTVHLLEIPRVIAVARQKVVTR